jgi:hypothetical protein
MNLIVLHNTTGNQHVDDILRGLISLYELLFPKRIRGYYLFGSYSDASAGAISDIDMSILFKDRFGDATEENKAYGLRDACALLCPIRLDLPISSEEQLQPEDVRLKLASVLLYGEDIRDTLALPTPAVYSRYITEWPLHFMKRLHEAKVLRYPLSYPQPDAEFYGYTQIRIPQWYPSSMHVGIKELVACVCWAATALLALQTGHPVGKKADAVKMYAELIADEWAEFIQTIYGKCAQQWSYHVPENPDDRLLLKDLCRQMVSFENHFLCVYKVYLLQQLQGNDHDALLFATTRLQEVIYPDVGMVTGVSFMTDLVIE